jgi:dolichyl-phosphate-mannose-protein mannosyltransferase
LILLAAVLVYSNSYTGLFVFDDEPAIVENPHIKQLWPLTAAMRAPAGTTVSGRPIVSLSLAINYALAPDFARDTLAMPAPGAPASEYDRLYANLWGYHAFNLAIHIAAALALFGVVRRTLLTDRLRPQFGEHATALALIVALIWTVHPLQTSAVTYIIQRAESLMALFYLLTLYCAIRALEGKRATLWTVASAFACALGMMSKESMVSAPLVVLMWGWLFGSGVRRGSDGGQTGVRRGSDEGQTGVRRGSDGGQTGVRRGSDEGQTRVRRGSDGGQTGVRRGSDRRLTPVRSRAPPAGSPCTHCWRPPGSCWRSSSPAAIVRMRPASDLPSGRGGGI